MSVSRECTNLSPRSAGLQSQRERFVRTLAVKTEGIPRGNVPENRKETMRMSRRPFRGWSGDTSGRGGASPGEQEAPGGLNRPSGYFGLSGTESMAQARQGRGQALGQGL